MIQVKFATDSDAFSGDLLTEEAARILRAVADRLEACGGLATGSLLDRNGNYVGTWRLS